MYLLTVVFSVILACLSKIYQPPFSPSLYMLNCDVLSSFYNFISLIGDTCRILQHRTVIFLASVICSSPSEVPPAAWLFVVMTFMTMSAPTFLMHSADLFF
ncbi:hypothetical protein NQD34_006034 [Periophthalmus magnuspinnatus]|nr:hypothetical protein NQD34_006034 [Periophthalmus magnuspinnatus]